MRKRTRQNDKTGYMTRARQLTLLLFSGWPFKRFQEIQERDGSRELTGSV